MWVVGGGLDDLAETDAEKAASSGKCSSGNLTFSESNFSLTTSSYFHFSSATCPPVRGENC